MLTYSDQNPICCVERIEGEWYRLIEHTNLPWLANINNSNLFQVRLVIPMVKELGFKGQLYKLKKCHIFTLPTRKLFYQLNLTFNLLLLPQLFRGFFIILGAYHITLLSFVVSNLLRINLILKSNLLFLLVVFLWHSIKLELEIIPKE